MTCTFFGHRDCDESIKEDLKKTVIDLIENRGVVRFLLGNHGNFDRLTLDVLRKCKREFPYIDFCVVLAYLPKNSNFDYETIYPEGIENVPKRFAISFRNNYMVEQSDFVVGYIQKPFGGAHKFFKTAQNKGKTCINLYKT